MKIYSFLDIVELLTVASQLSKADNKSMIQNDILDQPLGLKFNFNNQSIKNFDAVSY
jgi:hypothetical protein